ncbi:hypothetical protein [Pseudorhodoferax sp. Leaf274]|uniref:hypothetical protein n=1 Tax=Pseudorhodoferax sp. Leaf274 TaxID=1736318 RepID=UPI001F1F1080|nr:hypothetical protein [Pseudorhodoferax sp. Leaf274]
MTMRQAKRSRHRLSRRQARSIVAQRRAAQALASSGIPAAARPNEIGDQPQE